MRIPFHNVVRDHRSVGRERGRLGERKAVVVAAIFLFNIAFPIGAVFAFLLPRTGRRANVSFIRFNGIMLRSL